jgi:hypothetical protein
VRAGAWIEPPYLSGLLKITFLRLHVGMHRIMMQFCCLIETNLSTLPGEFSSQKDHSLRLSAPATFINKKG